MKSRSLVAIAVPALLLTSCGTGDVETLRSANVSGSDFNRQLAADYQGLSTYELDQMYDVKDANHFAKKGLMALEGHNVAPDFPDSRDIEDADKRVELQSARERLMRVLASDAAKKLPGPTARAQVSYDCWVEQQEEGFQYADVGACRNGFFKAMQVVETGIKDEPVARERVPAPAKPVASVPPDFRIFFDWDSAEITPQAADILRKAANDAKQAEGAAIRIVGHADRSGPTSYNQGLSVRRANAVARELAKNGVLTNGVTVYGRGEQEPLVPTGDGVREVQNRRVHIVMGSERGG